MLNIKIKRITAALLAAVMLSLSLVSCTASDSDVPAGMKLIESDVVDYSLYVPQAWVTDISTGVLTAYYSENDMSNITMMAFELDELTVTADDYWETNKADFEATFADMELISSSTTILGGAAANKYNYTATITGNKYEFLQVICVYAGTAYVFTYTAFEDKFDEHFDDVNLMLENFKFNF